MNIYINSVDIEVLFPRVGFLSEDVFWEEYSRGVMDVIKRGVRYGAAQIIRVAELHEVSLIVTCNTRHYLEKTSLPVMTPEEWIEKM